MLVKVLGGDTIQVVLHFELLSDGEGDKILLYLQVINVRSIKRTTQTPARSSCTCVETSLLLQLCKKLFQKCSNRDTLAGDVLGPVFAEWKNTHTLSLSLSLSLTPLLLSPQSEVTVCVTPAALVEVLISFRFQRPKLAASQISKAPRVQSKVARKEKRTTKKQPSAAGGKCRSSPFTHMFLQLQPCATLFSADPRHVLTAGDYNTRRLQTASSGFQRNSSKSGQNHDEWRPQETLAELEQQQLGHLLLHFTCQQGQLPANGPPR